MRTNKDSDLLVKVMKHSLDMICTIDKSGVFIRVSDACSRILGFERKELEGKPYLQFVHPEDHAMTLAVGKKIMGGQATTIFTNRYIHKSGAEVYISWSASWSEEDETIFCVARDVTEINAARQKLRQQDELYSALVEHGQDMLALLDRELNFKYSGGATLKELGYTHEQLLGLNVVSIIHPDDLPIVQEALLELTTTKKYVIIPYLRLKNLQGEWRWLEVTASNQLDNPSVGAIVTSSRDITDRKIASQKIEESEQRFRALFENNPDMVLIENRDGIILDINSAGEAFKGLSRQDIINRRLTDFLPSEAKEICMQYLHEAFTGKTIRFELDVAFNEHEKKALQITKIPVCVANEVIAVHSVVKDVTAVTQYHMTVERHARKLNTIFESITDAFFTLDRNQNFTYLNSEFERLLDLDRGKCVGKNIWEIFPEEVNGEFYKQYHLAIGTGQAVHFEAYLERVALWLEVKAFPSEEGLSVYFDDITDKVKSRQELEKLSLVASKTNNGVLIADKDWRIEWVNEGFTRLMGYSIEEAVGKRASELLHSPKTDKEPFSAYESRLLSGRPISFEILNLKKCGEELWLNVEISPIYSESGELSRFIQVQTDITPLKRSEQELEELAEDLYKQNRDLQQFTYIVSHNLRAPVANILGLIHLMPRINRDSELYDESLSNLSISAHRLDTVLRDMNTILSIRDSKDTVEGERVRLYDVLQQAIHSLQEPLVRHCPELIIDVPEDFTVSGNRPYLHSIFYNLFSNAIKYRAMERQLRIEISCLINPKAGAMVSFSDNGSGFDSAKFGNDVFKLYKRFHLDKKGRGIGLFLVKAHMEAIGGKIEVSSQPDQGTRFLLHFN